ncbi:MAG TPA: hypothetical protein VHO28_16075 [Ignavibacteriales bacterium]|nr:hypothetical protein [Ignavibacteriales bacterium]
MKMVLFLMMLMAELSLGVKAQTAEGFFSKLEVSVTGDIARFNFGDGKIETALYLTNNVDSLKMRISGEYIRNKYIMKEDKGIKTLFIYLRPKWNYDNIKGLGFGKVFLYRQRVQGQRSCL